MDGERDCSGAGSARRRRERRQHSWLRHEQLSVKMALSAALHHSRGVGPELHESPTGDRRRTGQWRRRSASCTTPLRDRSDLLRGCGQHLCLRLPGRRRQSRSVTWAAGAPSLTVVPVSDDRIDDAALQFLLQQSLLARAEEEEKAREEAEVKVMEEKVDKMMEQLAEKVPGRSRGVMGFVSRSTSRTLSVRPCAFVAHSEGSQEEEGEGSWSAAPHDASSTLLMTLLGVFLRPLYLAVHLFDAGFT